MAFTAVAALATGGGAAALGVSVFTAMSYVGIAMAVVGAVTKDKQLLKTGGLMSLMGGIGGAVEGAATSTASEAATQAGGEAAGAAAGEAAASQAAKAAAEAGTAAVQSPGVEMVQSISPGADLATTAAPVATPAAPAVQTAAPVVSQATPAAASSMPAGASSTVSGVQGAAAPVTPAATYPGEAMKIPADDFFGKVGGVWESLGGQGKAAAIQMVGGALSGANQSAMWNEKMDLENRALDLRSHGSAVPTYRKTGIVNSAKA